MDIVGLSISVITPPSSGNRRYSYTRQYSSKQYQDRHWGPFFEDPHLNRKTANAAKADSPVQVSIHLGTEAFLNCRVGMLRDKTVSGDSQEVINNNIPLPTLGHVGAEDNRQGVPVDGRQQHVQWRLQNQHSVSVPEQLAAENKSCSGAGCRSLYVSGVNPSSDRVRHQRHYSR